MMGPSHATNLTVKRVCAFLFAVLVTMVGCSGEVSASPSPPWVSCEAAVLMEWQTGSLLYAKNAFRRMYPASITKIMTALLALEKGRLEDVVTVSKEAAAQPGSSMYLKAGDQFSLEQLLYGMMLNSGNDAAWAIAEHIGGTAQQFFEMMNKRAKEIGAINTRFANPHGLTDPNHYTTAFDLALISRTCLKHPFFRHLVATKEKDAIDAKEEVKIKLANTNRLLWSYLGADGVKTGTTESAGQCLIASATRGSMRLIAVILNAQDRWADAAALLDYGFNEFRVAGVAKAGETILTIPARNAFEKDVPVVCATDLFGCLPRYSSGIWIDVDVPESVTAPCPRGADIGRATLRVGDVPIGGCELQTGCWVRKKNLGGIVVRWFSRLTKLVGKLGLL